MLKVTNAGFGYGNRPLLFSNVSFEVKAGETLAILGPNGIGKTTLLRCIMRFLALKEGEIEIDGAEASVEDINDGTYKIYRPFNIATKGDVSEAAQDFINYIMSKDGQAVIEENKYISVGEPEEYKSNGAEGKVVVAGSSSVSPVMEKLKEAYEKVNDKVEIEIQTSDSTTGMQNTIDGICDIGMASRELKDSETEAGLTATVIANDGIAVVVNNDNPIDELTSDQVKSVFTGETTTWADLEK